MVTGASCFSACKFKARDHKQCIYNLTNATATSALWLKNDSSKNLMDALCNTCKYLGVIWKNSYKAYLTYESGL